MNIVYASDDNFAEVMGVSIVSLLENNKDAPEINLFVLDDNISDGNKGKILEITNEYSRKIIFISINELLKADMTQQRGSLSTFSRLYLCDILPNNINKILYLDCDMLILGNLSDFYNTKIEDYYMVGINDCISESHLGNINLNSNSNYFNAGVLLINLNLWRRDGILRKFIEFSEIYNDNVPYADQGIINGILSSKSLSSELKYNCYTVVFDFTYKDLMKFRKPKNYFIEKEVNAAKKNPVIVHFTTSFLSLRPWVEGCKHPFVLEWLKYKALTPWKDVPLRKDNRSLNKKLFVKVYKLLPEVLAVGIAGWLHAKVVPWVRSKRK